MLLCDQIKIFKFMNVLSWGKISSLRSVPWIKGMHLLKKVREGTCKYLLSTAYPMPLTLASFMRESCAFSLGSVLRRLLLIAFSLLLVDIVF